MSIYRARLRITYNALTLWMSGEQIRLQVPPKLFGVNSWIQQIIRQWIRTVGPVTENARLPKVLRTGQSTLYASSSWYGGIGFAIMRSKVSFMVIPLSRNNSGQVVHTSCRCCYRMQGCHWFSHSTTSVSALFSVSKPPSNFSPVAWVDRARHGL